MCLGIPGKVVNTFLEHDVLMGKVSFGGIAKNVCLEHVPDVKVGQYVLVHVGFALSKIDEEEAARVFEFLEGMNQLDELHTPGDSSDGEAESGGELRHAAPPPSLVVPPPSRADQPPTNDELMSSDILVPSEIDPIAARAHERQEAASS